MNRFISSGFVVIIVNDLQRLIESMISSIMKILAKRPRSENKPVCASKVMGVLVRLKNVARAMSMSV